MFEYIYFLNILLFVANTLQLSRLLSTAASEAKESDYHSIISDKEKVTGDGIKHEFQAETRMLLDIVARSLYSEKEVNITTVV